MSDLTQPFVLDGPLPWGVSAIEASAGTGKTFTLSSLVVRYIAEAAVTVDEHLVVTFTRAAAAELRDRVRARISEAVSALREQKAHPDDLLLTHLLNAEDDERALRLGRLEDALNDFDAATITTIHGFAQQVLATLGVSAPGDPDARLVDDTTDLVAAVASDHLAALSIGIEQPALLVDLPYGRIASAALTDGAEPAALLPKLDDLVTGVKQVLGNPGMRLAPDSDEDGVETPIVLMRALILAVADTVQQRRRASGTMSFDDILTQLRDALRNEHGGAKEALRRRFRVALIDEFQDTDLVQWDIFSTIFAPSERTQSPGSLSSLVLVGDPKQAIYAFRGASVDTYLQAMATPGVQRSSLPTNWRSNGAVIAGLHALLEGATFGDNIPFVPVSATAANEPKRLLLNGTPSPGVAIRLSSHSGFGRDSKGKYLRAPAAKLLIKSDLVNQVLELLQAGELPSGTQHRPVMPSDIAILVSSNAEAQSYQRALSATGVPAVVLRSGNVFESPAAQQWRRLIAGVAQPSNASRARAAAIGWFFGWTPEQLDAASDTEVASVQSQLHDWSETLQKRGLTAFFNGVANQSEVASHVLGRPDGDRSLTDLQHLAEVVQVEAGSRQVIAASLGDLLDELAARRDETETEATQRRVETDADAVQVVTMHSSKGLEFPIVLCPSLAQPGPGESSSPVVYTSSGQRVLDLRKNTARGGAPEEARAAATDERRAERLRLAYVALTRAEHHVVAWWVDQRDSAKSPLGKLLFARDSTGSLDPAAFARPTVEVPSDEDALDFLSPVAARGADAFIGSALSISSMAGYPQDPYYRYTAPTLAGVEALDIRHLDRTLDRVPERWSFTLITNRQASWLEEHGLRSDEAPQPLVVVPESHDSELPWANVPGSAAFGTLVHLVYEQIDFCAPDLTAEVAGWVEQLGRSADWPADNEVIVDGIVKAIQTPLGQPLGDLSLRSFTRADRLDELGFELNLGQRGSRATGAQIGKTIQRHLSPGDPLETWAADVARGTFDVTLAGHLTGSIDIVLRHPTDNTYFVVDYKTNKLSAPGQATSGIDYSPARLPEAMAHHHYPLQGLLYTVALHRFLRWRLADYEPDRHLGGMVYLFVRGMTGAETPVSPEKAFTGHRQGVYFWRPAAELILELSDLLDGTPQ